jgi:DNA-binding response OmpR family regulator
MGQILIVEDEKSLCELLVWVLQQEGYEVLAAANAAEGIEMGLVNRPGLVIIDWMLRHSMHGGEVARRLRDADASVKTIVITGHPEIVSQARQWRDSIDAVIEKPFHMRHLLVAVRRMMPQRAWALANLIYQ